MARDLARKTYARISDVHNLPSLIDSFNGALKLYFPGNSDEARQFELKYWFDEPKYGEDECLERDLTFASPLYIKVAMLNSETGEVITQDIFLGDFPIMTTNGTFIINGTERVVVSQLIRSPGVYFAAEKDPATGRSLATAKLIPDRGAWMEFETRRSDYLTIKFNRKRTIPVTILLRALAAVRDGMDDISPIKAGSDEELLAIFEAVDNNPDHRFIEGTLKQEPTWEPKGNQTLAQAALIEFDKRMRPGDQIGRAS